MIQGVNAKQRERNFLKNIRYNNKNTSQIILTLIISLVLPYNFEKDKYKLLVSILMLKK